MIAADTFKWNFPVMIPNEMPRDNIWIISLCDDRSCRSPDDPTVRAYFPMAGFNLYERSPDDLQTLVDYAAYAPRNTCFSAISVLVTA